MVIGVWLSQAGLLYPLSADCFGMFEDSVIFPAFLVVIILLDAKTFRVGNSTQILGNEDLMERHVVFIFCFNVKHSKSCVFFVFYLIHCLYLCSNNDTGVLLF